LRFMLQRLNIISDMSIYGLAHSFQRFGGILCLRLQGRIVRFEAHAAETEYRYWIMSIYGLEHSFQRFGGILCLRLQGRIVRFEVHAAETEYRYYLGLCPYMALHIVSNVSEEFYASVFKVERQDLRFMMLRLNIDIISDMSIYGLAHSFQRFGGFLCPRLQGRTVRFEAHAAETEYRYYLGCVHIWPCT
jgi:hypothetical protein